MLSKNEIKFIQSLHQKKYRQENRLFIAEGSKIVEELLNSNFIIERLLGTQEYFNTHPKVSLSIITEIVTEVELERITCLTNPQQVLAVVSYEYNQLTKTSNDWYIALDGIQDPGNFGTIIRTADWFGIKNIVCSTDTVEVYNPKVIQSTMGSFTRVNIYYANLNEWLTEQELPIYGAVLDGKSLFTLSKSAKGIVLIGNEGKGIRKENMQQITIPVTIPRIGDAESLNAAVATGIILSQLTK